MGWFSHTDEDNKNHDLWGFANPGKAPGQSGGLFDNGLWSGGGKEDRSEKKSEKSDDGDKPYDAMGDLFG